MNNESLKMLQLFSIQFSNKYESFEISSAVL